MELKLIIFLLISSFQVVSVAQDRTDLNNVIVYSQEGSKDELLKLFKNETGIAYFNDGYCIGCVQYLIDAKVIKKVVWGKQDFSILHLSQSSALRLKELYFTDNSFFPLEADNRLVLFVKIKEEIKIINYKSLVGLSGNFEKDKKLFVKEFKKYIKAL